MNSVVRVLLCFALGLAMALPAAGAELRVLCPNALRAPLLELARSFVRGSGHKVEFIFASVGAIHKRVAGGESADVVIGTARGVDALVRLGRAIEGSEATIARTALGLAVRSGAAQTPVADAQALTQLLRDAASLVHPDANLGAQGGGQATELLDRLGLTAEVKTKSRLVADSREVAKRVAAGAADVGIAHMNDLVGVQGVVAIGPLLDPPTSGFTYAAAVVRRSGAVETGRAFIELLTSADAKAVFRAAGYAPND